MLKNTKQLTKRMISLILVTSIILSCLNALYVLRVAAACKDGDYSYKVSNEKATITGYHGDGRDVTIPFKLGGYDVDTIGDNAFFNCNSLKSINLGSVTSIGKSAFWGCTDLMNLKIPDSVTSIGESAFYGCTNLTNLEIPDSVTIIDDGAFGKCIGLTSVWIPNNVINIGLGVFACSKLTSFDVDTNNPNYSSQEGALYNKDKTTLLSLFVQYSDEFTIPDGVTSIGVGAFFGCEGLKSITISNGVTSIGDDAFRYCNSLTNVQIPDSLTSIGSYAFSECRSLTNILIPNSVTSIEKSSFEYCNKLTILCYENSYAHVYAIENSIPLKMYKYKTQFFTVTYNYSENGGDSASKGNGSLNTGEDVDLTPTASKPGWEFVGWNTDSSATIGLASLKIGTSNITLYAIYKKTLTGTFIDYKGTKKTTRTAQTTIYNKVTSGAIAAPVQNTYNDWTSRGWSTSATSNAGVTSNYTISADTIFYGLYQRSLTLSYDANKGHTTPPSQTGTQYTNSYDISTYTNPRLKLAEAISRSGYTFNKWAASSDESQYNAGDTITISSDTTMYAIWISAEDNEIVAFADPSDNNKYKLELEVQESLNIIGKVRYEIIITPINSSADTTKGIDINIKIPFGFNECHIGAESNENGYMRTFEDDSRYNIVNREYVTIKNAKSGYIYGLIDFSADHKIGDVNLSGEVTVEDATLIQKHIAKIKINPKPLTQRQLSLADANEDGKVTLKDATDIQKYAAKIAGYEKLPPNKKKR